MACSCAVSVVVPATGPLHRKPNSKLAPKFLREHHASHFMVLNLSESSYDYEPYDDQVRPSDCTPDPSTLTSRSPVLDGVVRGCAYRWSSSSSRATLHHHSA